MALYNFLFWFISIMIISINELIEFVNIGFSSFLVVVLRSQILSKRCFQVCLWDSWHESVISKFVQKCFREEFKKNIFIWKNTLIKIIRFILPNSFIFIKTWCQNYIKQIIHVLWQFKSKINCSLSSFLVLFENELKFISCVSFNSLNDFLDIIFVNLWESSFIISCHMFSKFSITKW